MSDKPLRNFDKFEEGHYYVYTGEKPSKWIKQMDFVLDHKIHKCVDVWGHIPVSASFEDSKGGVWHWGDVFDNWVEVESPEAVFGRVENTLRYDKINKTWEIHKVVEGFFKKANNKNGYENGDDVYYICKRKHNKKEESIVKSSNGVCKYCGKETITFFSISQKGSILKLGCRCRDCANSYDLIKTTPFGFKLELDRDEIVTYRDYDLNIIKQLDELDAKENVPLETPMKMASSSLAIEPITFNFDFKRDKSWETAKAFLSEWVNFWTDKRKDVDKKDNVFKKYIRNKKYMKFVKEKK